MTALMPGVVLEDGLAAGGGSNGLTYDYDPVGLAAGVSILDVERNGQPVAADVVTVSLFGEGRDSDGPGELCGANSDTARGRVPEPDAGGARTLMRFATWSRLE